jgi:hypothetical protein
LQYQESLDAALVVIRVAGACSGFAPAVLATVTGRAALELLSSTVTRISRVWPALAVTLLLSIVVKLPFISAKDGAANAALMPSKITGLVPSCVNVQLPPLKHVLVVKV